METAERLCKEATEKGGKNPNQNKLNVAFVCTGYAFELIFKIPVKISGIEKNYQHETHIAYVKMCRKYQDGFEKIVNAHGWDDIIVFMHYLDSVVHHRDRKYWMQPPKGGAAYATAYLDGPKSISSLADFHKELWWYVHGVIETDSDILELWDNERKSSSSEV